MTDSGQQNDRYVPKDPAWTPLREGELIGPRQARFLLRTGAPSPTWALEKTVLPWLRRFPIRSLKRGIFHPLLYDQPEPSSRPALPIAEFTVDDEFTEKVTWRHLPKTFRLKANKSSAVCVSLPCKARPYCQSFDVATQFFQYPDDDEKNMSGNKRMSNRPYRTRRDEAPTLIPPYVIHRAETAVILGVVAAGLEHQIGNLNSQWINRCPTTDSSTVGFDPAKVSDAPGHATLVVVPRELYEHPATSVRRKTVVLRRRGQDIGPTDRSKEHFTTIVKPSTRRHHAATGARCFRSHDPA